VPGRRTGRVRGISSRGNKGGVARYGRLEQKRRRGIHRVSPCNQALGLGTLKPQHGSSRKGKICDGELPWTGRTRTNQ